MKKRLIFTVVAGVAVLSGCSSFNELAADRLETVEIYHIFDFKTSADIATVSRAAAGGLAQNTNSVQSSSPLQLGKPTPAVAGRFTLTDMSAAIGGNAGAFMQMAAAQNGGAMTKIANCDGAVWTSKAVRHLAGSSNLTLYSCLYRYKAGYNLDMYAVFQKKSGGVGGVFQKGADALVGDAESWVSKTIVDTVRSIEGASGAKAVHVEGQPELGPLPAIDKLGRG